MGTTQGKKFLVIMINGDTYSVDKFTFERLSDELGTTQGCLVFLDTKSNLWVKVLPTNVSALVETEVGNA